MAVAQRHRLEFSDLTGVGFEGSHQVHWQYVEVEATIQPSGFIVPKVLIWPDSRRFPISRISKCQMRDRDNTWYYEVIIGRATKQLWYRHGAFFVCVPEGGILHGGEPPSMDRYELRKRYGFNA